MFFMNKTFQAGGNRRAREFLESQDDWDPLANINQRYNTRAAALYKDKVILEFGIQVPYVFGKFQKHTNEKKTKNSLKLCGNTNAVNDEKIFTVILNSVGRVVSHLLQFLSKRWIVSLSLIAVKGGQLVSHTSQAFFILPCFWGVLRMYWVKRENIIFTNVKTNFNVNLRNSKNCDSMPWKERFVPLFSLVRLILSTCKWNSTSVSICKINQIKEKDSKSYRLLSNYLN